MEFHTSKWRVIALMLLGIGMSAMSAFAATITHRPILQLVCGAGVFFFAAIVPMGIRQFRRSGPSIIIDARGVEDVRWKIGPILWADIVAISVAKMESAQALVIHTRDPEAYISRLPGWKQKFARASMASGFPPITLGFSGLKPGIDEAVAYLSTHHPDKLRA